MHVRIYSAVLLCSPLLY